MPPSPTLPPGQRLELPGRGTTFVRTLPGPPGAPTVLLLHGWTATADLNWFPSYEPMGRHYRIVAMDARGHGQGIRSRGIFSLEDCADDIAAACEQLGVERAIAVGYSMGGAIAQLLWRRHPELVEGLVLCATARNFGRRARERALFASMLGLSVAARFTPRAVRLTAFDRVVVPTVRGRPLAEWLASEVRRNDPSVIMQAGWSIGRFTSHRWIGDVDVPTSVVLTTLDSVVSPQRQLRLAESIPDAAVFTVAGDHDVCVTGASRFVPALLEATAHVVERGGGRATPRRSSSGRR